MSQANILVSDLFCFFVRCVLSFVFLLHRLTRRWTLFRGRTGASATSCVLFFVVRSVACTCANGCYEQFFNVSGAAPIRFNHNCT
ncbi:hypothetical protein PLICRDRAFT_294946 [Plicaturopsis crispa FD-325 SS-3]|nr:hypothetical protein PLICRDRAFT_294946 [Plicaturopsis crispa FD-325 SS-3]